MTKLPKRSMRKKTDPLVYNVAGGEVHHLSYSAAYKCSKCGRSTQALWPNPHDAGLALDTHYRLHHEGTLL